MNISVGSSHGVLTVDSVTGHVIECSGEDYITDISRFDLKEYTEYYGISEPPSYIDILDLGYWTRTGVYEMPEADWREEHRKRKRLTDEA